MHLITERCTCLCPASSGWPLWGHPDNYSGVCVCNLACMFPIIGQHFSINKGRESLSSIIITLSSHLVHLIISILKISTVVALT